MDREGSNFISWSLFPVRSHTTCETSIRVAKVYLPGAPRIPRAPENSEVYGSGTWMLASPLQALFRGVFCPVSRFAGSARRTKARALPAFVLPAEPAFSKKQTGAPGAFCAARPLCRRNVFWTRNAKSRRRSTRRWNASAASGWCPLTCPATSAAAATRSWCSCWAKSAWASTSTR